MEASNVNVVKGVGIGIFVAIFGIVAVSSQVNAQTTPPGETPTTTNETKTTETKETTPKESTNRAKITAARCTIAETKIEARSTKLTTAKDTHDKKFKGIIERVNKLATQAKEQGYDTTSLTSAQAKAQTALDSYKTAFDTYKTSLAATKTLACGESDGAFATALAKSRTDLIAARTAGQTLKTTITTSVIPAVKQYGAWLKEKAATTTMTEDTKKSSEGTN